MATSYTSSQIKEKRWERQQKKKNDKRPIDKNLTGNPMSKSVCYHRNVLTGNQSEEDSYSISEDVPFSEIFNEAVSKNSRDIFQQIEQMDSEQYLDPTGGVKKKGGKRGRKKASSESQTGGEDEEASFRYIPWNSLFGNNYLSKASRIDNNNSGFGDKQTNRGLRSLVNTPSRPSSTFGSPLRGGDTSHLQGNNYIESTDENNQGLLLKKKKVEKNRSSGTDDTNVIFNPKTSTGENNNNNAETRPSLPFHFDEDIYNDELLSGEEGVIRNPEAGQGEGVSIEEFEEEEKLCFFCHYCSSSDAMKSFNMNLSIMLRLIEDMLFKCNISIEAVGVEAAYYYNKNIYQPSILQGKQNVPRLTADDVVTHYRKHLNLSPIVHYSNALEILFNAREVLKNVLFLRNTKTGEIIPSKQNNELLNKNIQLSNSIHNADVTKSPYYAGDSLHWTLKSKGAFLNDGTNITEDHKKLMNDWKEEPYKPMFIEDID
jgi:hypothetical protein